MIFRPWVYCDNLEVYRIEKECFKEPWTQQMICDAFLSDNFIGYVAEYEGKVIGYVALTYCLDEAEINLVAVTHKYRRQKVAETLLLKIFEVLKEKCVEKIFLEVRRNNHSAKALYEKLGFTYISVREKYYGGVEDALIMSKALSQ